MAISQNLVADPTQFDAHLRRSNTLAEACGGREPADFSLRVPAVRDGKTVVTCLAYLATPKSGKVISYERIPKVDFDESSSVFHVQSAPRSARIYILTRISKSGPESQSVQEMEKLRSHNFEEVLGKITVTCP
jgi:hypothetical protein